MSVQILIVEDEVSIRELLTAVFTDEGYRVATAGDGQEALRTLAAGRFDVVVSNVMMPRLDGRALARAMRADPALQGIPLILMSAAGTALIPGDDHAAFIPKPFDLGHMLATVERVLKTTSA